MNDNQDVELMMEFRQRFKDLWKKYLIEQGVWEEWKKYYQEVEE